MKANVKTFKDALQKIASFSDNVDSLIRRSNWGDFNFVEAETEVRTVVRIAVDLLGLPLECLPDNAIDQGTNSVNDLAPSLQELSKFSIVNQPGDLSQRKNNLLSRIHSASDRFYNAVGLWIPYLAYHRGDAAENIKKLNAAIEDASKVSAAHIADLEKNVKVSSDLVEAIKSSAADAGVAVHTQDFQKESEENDKIAKRWLVFSIVLAVLTFGMLGVFYCAKIDAHDLVHLVPMLGCRVLTITFLFTITIWCGRMYKAMRNQAIQNRHRALGLKTFRAFVDATQDKQTKDAVLRETTHTIFSSTPTGLINESGQGEVDPSIVQIAGGMLSSQGNS